MSNTVTLEFKGDNSDLSRAVRGVEADVERVQAAVTGIGVAGAAVAGVAAAGAVAAGVAIAGLPLLFGGIGIAAAAQSQRVKDAFSGLKDHVVAQVQQMAAPFEPMLVGIANKAQATFDRIGPSLSRIFSDVSPMVDRLSDGVMKFVEGAMPGFEHAIDNARPVIDAIGRGLEKLGPAIGDFFAKISDQSGPAASALDGFFDAVVWLVDKLGDAIVFVLKWQDVLIPLGLTLAGIAVGVKAVRFAIEAWRVAQIALNLVMAMNPIAAAILIIAALAAGAIYCYEHFQTFRDVVDNVWAAIKTAFSVGVDWVKNAFQWFVDLPGRMSDWFGRAKDAAVAKFTELVDWIKGLPGRILGAIGNLATTLADRGRGLITGLWDGAKSIFEQVIRWVADLPRMIVDAIGDLGRKLFNAGASLIQGFADGINYKASAAQDAAGNVVGGTAALFPQSPAKTGPFSGRGYTLYRGQKLIEDFGLGMASVDLRDIARTALSGAQVALSGAVAPGGGAVVAARSGGPPQAIEVRVAPGADSALCSLLMNLARAGQLQFVRVA